MDSLAALQSAISERMATAVGSRRRTPADLVSKSREALQTLSTVPEGKPREQAVEKLAAQASEMRLLIYGDTEAVGDAEQAGLLREEFMRGELILQMATHIAAPDLGFETRKDIAQVINHLLRKHPPAVEYVQARPAILHSLLAGYADPRPDVALCCGGLVRECVRHEGVCEIVLKDRGGLFEELLTLVQLPTFDVATDAFSTLHDVLTLHEQLYSEFLLTQYDAVFCQEPPRGFARLLMPDQNYVTRRLSLKLLGDVLLDRANFKVMTKYIASTENLRKVMECLKDDSDAIKYEAFHVFKIFVANPKKEPEIVETLAKNSKKLCAFLGNFRNEKDDENFQQEKEMLIEVLSNLPGLTAGD